MSDNQVYVRCGGYANVPITHDYENALSEYLAERLTESEWPFAGSVEDDFAVPVNYSTGIVEGPPHTRELPPIGINEYLHPGGASRFGRALLLIDHRYMPSVLNQCWGITWDGTGAIPSASAARTGQPINLVLKNGGATFEPRLYLQQPVQVDSIVAGAGTPRQAWLCPFVDQRYMLLRQLFRAEDSLVRSNTTWAEVFTRWEATTDGTLASIPSPAASWQQPDPGYFSVARSAGYALDHAAHSIGCRVVFDPASEDFEIQTSTLADSRFNSVNGNLQILLGEQDGAPRTEVAPVTQMECRQLHDHYDNDTWELNAATAANAPATESAYQETHVHSTFYLESYGGAVDSGSQTDSDALTQAVADANWNWQQRQFCVTYAGNMFSDGYWKSGYSDYSLTKISCGATTLELMTTEQSSPPGVVPFINISQRADLYRHNQELARITLDSTGIPLGQQSGTGEILTANKSATEYDGTPHQITVNSIYAVSTAIAGGHTLSCYYQSEDGWYLVQGEPGPSGGGAPWIRFRVLSPVGYQESGIWLVKVTQQEGGIVQVDDEIQVHDPNNLFADVVFEIYQSATQCDLDTLGWKGGSTGTGYLRTPTTSANVPDGVTRWEVETCSRAIDDIVVTIDECLKEEDSTGTGIIESAGSHWNQSAYPAVDLPPEFTDGPGGEGHCWEVEFSNPLELNALAESTLRLRRSTRKQPSLPYNTTTPHNKGVTTINWYLYAVEENRTLNQGRFARFIKVTKGGTDLTGANGGWTLVIYWDGNSPIADLNCKPTVDCEFDCDCLETGDEAVGIYDPTNHKYRLIATDSAMLGPPDDADIVVGVSSATCGYNFLYQPSKIFTCGETPVVDTVAISTVTQTVYTGSYRTSQDICFYTADIEVCATTPTDDECRTLCAECDCEDYICAWQWNEATSTWDSVAECPELVDCDCQGDAPVGPPGSDPEYVSYPCGATTELCVPCDECTDCTETSEIEFSFGSIVGDLSTGDRIQADPATATWTAIPGQDCCAELSVEFFDPWGSRATRTATVCISTWPTIANCQLGGQYSLTLTWDVATVFGMTLPTELGATTPSTCATAYGTAGCGILPTNPDPGGTWDIVQISVACCTVGAGMVEASKGVHYLGSDFHTAELGAAPPPKPTQGTQGTQPQGWGEQFLAAYPSYFAGCNCKKDIIAVMNRWERKEGEPTPDQVNNVAKTLYSKQKRTIQKRITVESLGATIQQFVSQIADQTNG